MSTKCRRKESLTENMSTGISDYIYDKPSSQLELGYKGWCNCREERNYL